MDHLCLLPLEGPLKWSRGTGQEKSPVWQAMASWSTTPGECLETFQTCWRRAFLSVLPSFSSVSAKISLEVHREWRAHCPALCCLSLALIATCVLSYVVIALIANICWLLTICHCAKRFTHITSLILLQPCEVLLSSFHKWENWGVESCDLH